MESERSKLEAVRARIDALDAELMKLVDERSALATRVGEIKREAGTASDQLAIRPAREAQLIRALLKSERHAARPEMIVRMWRELIGESLRIQGPFHLTVWGGRNPARTVDLARLRFGGAPTLSVTADPEAALAYLTALPRPIFALEEPLAPGAFAALAGVAARLDTPIVLDESATRVAHLRDLPGPPDRWIVNVRVSKMGGVRRAVAVVRAARAAGHRVIVGAQVGETSLLTRAALPVAAAAGPALVAMEGAFGTLLLARDVCDPPLMFGAGGRLVVADHPRLASPGLGVA